VNTGSAGGADGRQVALGVAASPTEDDENDSAVQLRGLPYRATAKDIRVFLGRHAEFLKDDNSVQLVLNRDGRPSGFARVQFNSAAAARSVRDELHMQHMKVAAGGGAGTGGGTADQNAGDRYVEIFLFSERPNKLRFKKSTVGDSGATNIEEEEEFVSLGVTKDQVAKELRDHMASPGKGQLLLSMLGVALSQGARLYLKKTDQGLKHFLSQFPQEFSVEGAKGRECVSYLPVLAKGGNNSDLPLNFQGMVHAAPAAPAMPRMPAASPGPVASRRSNDSNGGPATGSISDLQKGWEEPAMMVPESPQPMSLLNDTPKGMHGLDTPSNWGTPQQFDGLWPQRQSGGAHRYSVTGDSVGGGAAPNPAESQHTFAPPLYNDSWSSWAVPPPEFWPQAGYWPQAGTPHWGQTVSNVAAAAAAPPPMSVPAPEVIPAQGTSVAGHEEPAQGVTIKLRGLPFNSTEQDVLAFFAKYDVVERIADCPRAVRLFTKSNGKPMGTAHVEMQSAEDADAAVKALHGQWIGTRYIEVFCESDGQSSTDLGRQGSSGATKVVTGGSTSAPGEVPSTMYDVAGDTGGSTSSFATAPPQWEAPPWTQQTQQQGRPEDHERSWEALFDFLKKDMCEVTPGVGLPMSSPPPSDPGMEAVQAAMGAAHPALWGIGGEGVGAPLADDVPATTSCRMEV